MIDKKKKKKIRASQLKPGGMAAGPPRATLGSTCGERSSGEPHQHLRAAGADKPGRALQGTVAP